MKIPKTKAETLLDQAEKAYEGNSERSAALALLSIAASLIQQRADRLNTCGHGGVGICMPCLTQAVREGLTK